MWCIGRWADSFHPFLNSLRSMFSYSFRFNFLHYDWVFFFFSKLLNFISSSLHSRCFQFSFPVLILNAFQTFSYATNSSLSRKKLFFVVVKKKKIETKERFFIGIKWFDVSQFIHFVCSNINRYFAPFLCPSSVFFCWARTNLKWWKTYTHDRGCDRAGHRWRKRVKDKNMNEKLWPDRPHSLCYWKMFYSFLWWSSRW